MSELSTPYGTVTVLEHTLHVDASGSELYAWANRPGNAWPCSELADSDGFGVSFDDNGVYEYRNETDHLRDNLGADEMNAWTSDAILAAKVPTDHPAYFVACGQFHPEH